MSNVMHQHPRRQAAYRADTDGSKMVGVVHCSWRCRVCGETFAEAMRPTWRSL